MFIELVDALRCPNSHAESWMVVSAARMEARHIITGTLGCPVCSAEFPIRAGVADFRQGSGAGSFHLPDQAEDVGAASGVSSDAAKLAALLDLSDAAGFAVLEGAWGRRAQELAAITETPLILVDPPDYITGETGISVIRCETHIPLASGAARAIAVADPSRIDSAIRTVRARGRVVAPVALSVPADVRELARDESVWVGEREAPASPLVTLHVRRA